jgi:hypothetical protein
MRYYRKRRPEYFAGLDLGPISEPTAFAALERTIGSPDDPVDETLHYAVRHLERFGPGTPYAEIRTRLTKIIDDPILAGCRLAIDQTGVGKPVVDLFRSDDLGIDTRRIMITNGHAAVWDDHGGWLVPKKDLVGTLQVLLQARRLKVAPALELAPVLVRELAEFQARVSLASDQLDLAWRERPHDDLVLAVAVAAWDAERVGVRACESPFVYSSGPAWRTRW